MPGYQVHSIYSRVSFGLDSARTICYWRRLPKKHTLKETDQTFHLSEKESWELQNRYAKGPVNFQLMQVVRYPGGSVYRPEYAVVFFHRPSAMLFKLTRGIDSGHQVS